MKVDIEELDLKNLGKLINQAVERNTSKISNPPGAYLIVAYEQIARKVVVDVINELKEEGYNIEYDTESTLTFQTSVVEYEKEKLRCKITRSYEQHRQRSAKW